VLEADPGSFRDPASHVVFDGDRVLRLLDERGARAWESLSKTRFFNHETQSERLIRAEPLAEAPDGASAALEHPRVPFISYPWEWTFSMLKDAALLHLELLAGSLAEGITIKDATPFNIQFIEGKPVFIDVGSFEEYRRGEPWIGYRQFTRQFLFPLLLRAWVGVPFQPWLRGAMDGPTAAEMRRLLPLGKRLRPAALLHVTLQARMEERLSGTAVRGRLGAAGFDARLILANVDRLHRLIEGVDWDPDVSGWSEYRSCGHVGRDREDKAGFLEAALERHRPERVLDLGANDAYFSDIARQRGALAVAIDGDETVLDSVYRSGSAVSVALTDLTDPSPAQGWAGAERPGLVARARPDLVIAYGLIHHLIYTSSVPPSAVVHWLASFQCPLVVEFVGPDDEMVGKLTANKLHSELHPGRDEASFKDLVSQRFEVIAERSLESGTRVLWQIRPRR